jgi:hypothetical protein
MGTSHQKSNLAAYDSTVTIRGFATISATTLTGGAITSSSLTVTGDVTVTGSVTSDTVIASLLRITKNSSYIRIGDYQMIMFGSKSYEASIIAEATAVNATPGGSLYLSSGTNSLWVFDSNTTASQVIYAT